MYGNLQMLPSPIADPANADIAVMLLAKCSLFAAIYRMKLVKNMTAIAIGATHLIRK